MRNDLDLNLLLQLRLARPEVEFLVPPSQCCFAQTAYPAVSRVGCFGGQGFSYAYLLDERKSVLGSSPSSEIISA